MASTILSRTCITHCATIAPSAFAARECFREAHTSALYGMLALGNHKRPTRHSRSIASLQLTERTPSPPKHIHKSELQSQAFSTHSSNLPSDLGTSDSLAGNRHVQNLDKETRTRISKKKLEELEQQRKDNQSLDQIEKVLSARHDALHRWGDEIKTLCQQLNKRWKELYKERRRLRELERNKTRLLEVMADSAKARAQSHRKEPHSNLRSPKYDEGHMGASRARGHPDEEGGLFWVLTVIGLILWWAWPRKAKDVADTEPDASQAGPSMDPDGGPWKTFLSIVGLILLWPFVLVLWGMVGLDRFVFGDDLGRKAGGDLDAAVETVAPDGSRDIEDTGLKDDLDPEEKFDLKEDDGGVDSKDKAFSAEDDGSEELDDSDDNADSNESVGSGGRSLHGLLWKQSPA